MTGQRSPASLRFPESVRDELMQARIFTDLLRPDAPSRIGVCGCHVGAGASTVALNLALMLCERSARRIVLVDADLRCTGLSEGDPGPGFAEFVAARVTPAHALRELAPGLTMMPAGRTPEPLETLRKGVDRLPLLSTSAELVIVDLPPVLAYPDAAIIAPSLDGIVLVLEAEETRRPVAQEALRRLEAAGSRLVGVVLNKRRRYIPQWLYRLL